MVSLEDFSFSSKPTLDDFAADMQGPKVENKPSNLNYAATTAALSGNPADAVDTYRTISAEMEVGGTSPTADQIIADNKQKAMQNNQQALTELLLSKDYSDEQKQKFVTAALDENSAQFKAHNALSIEALSAPVQNESKRAETVRLDIAPEIDKIIEVKKQQQAILNREMAKDNPGFLNAAADVLGMFAPFAYNKTGADVLAGMREGKVSAYTKALSLAGSSKEDVRKMIENTAPEDRLELVQKVVNLVNNSEGIVFADGNDFAAKEYLQDVLDQGTYSDGKKFVDNVFSVLDVLGLGGAIKSGATALKGASTAENIAARSVKTHVQPVAIGPLYKDTNPDKAKAAYIAAMNDESGEAAQALFGASREDVVADMVLPELRNQDGTVMAKVGDPERSLRFEEDLSGEVDNMDFITRYGHDELFQAEKAQLTALQVNRFSEVAGLTARHEMFQIGEHADGVNIRGVYGPPEGGFESAEAALDLAKMTFKDLGVAEQDIKLLVRKGPDYHVVEPEELDKYLTKDVIKGGPSGASGLSLERVPKDYLITVDHKYTFNPADVAQMSEADVKYNVFDRMGVFLGTSGAGSLQRHMMDAASNLHPVITKSASNAVDRAAGLEANLSKKISEFGEAFNKADPEMQRVMDTMIREANEHSKDFNYNEMVAAGLRENEINTLRKFREFWDEHYRLSNADAVKTLSNRGFKEMVDAGTDTKLFVKPVNKNARHQVTHAYDTSTGEIRPFKPDEIDALYEQEGLFGALHRPIHIGDEVVEHVVVPNKPNAGYLKALTPESNVLEYRKGYYSVHYTDPYFIVKRVKTKSGQVYTKAIATSGSRKEAEALRLRLRDEGDIADEDIFVRSDLKTSSEYQDHTWDIYTAGGHSSQRIRGKRLEEPDSYVDNPLKSNILDPVSSMIASARSISRRVVMRDMLDTHKRRFLQQYEEFLPKNKYGEPVFPSNVRDVIYRAEQAENGKKLADARTTFTYLKYLEDGYINAIDDSYKTILKNIADILGQKGFDRLDKAARWMASGRGPSAMAKNTSFNLSIALNPLRQFFIQSFQSLQLVAAFPEWVASGTAVPQVAIITSYQLGIKPSEYLLKGAKMTAKEAADMYAAFKKTGQIAAIDKQNLIRGALLDLADQTHLGGSKIGKAFRTVTAPLHISRKVGFDAGESVTTITSWLAHRDAAVRAGKDVSRTDVQAEIAALSRNFTYNMNAAGDMPYNQNALSLAFQFMQVPHKAALGMLTNRNISVAQKARLAAFNSLMFPLPPAIVFGWFGSILPEDPDYREIIANGVMGSMFNGLLSRSFGEDVTIDWSGLAPTDQYGLYEFVHSLFTLDVGAIVAATPSGSLLFGNNPRITNFVKNTARYFNLIDDYEDPTTFGQVAKSFAEMSSGYSNFMKGFYALEYEKKYMTINNPNSNIPTPQAIAMIFGFNSIEDARRRYVDKEMWQKSNEFKADVTKTFNDAYKHVVSANPNGDAAELATKISSEAWRVYGNDNIEAKKIIDMQLKKKLADKDASFYQHAIQQSGMYEDTRDIENLIKAAPYKDEEARKQLLDTIQFMKGND